MVVIDAIIRFIKREQRVIREDQCIFASVNKGVILQLFIQIVVKFLAYSKIDTLSLSTKIDRTYVFVRDIRFRIYAGFLTRKEVN